MSSQAQISATISAATKERLDHFAESRGLKKNFVVEQALLFFMEARRELPDEALTPARLVLVRVPIILRARIPEILRVRAVPLEAESWMLRAEVVAEGGECSA